MKKFKLTNRGFAIILGVFILAFSIFFHLQRKQYKRMEKTLLECVDTGNFVRDRSDRILREATKRLKEVKKERDELKRQLELCDEPQVEGIGEIEEVAKPSKLP